MIKKVEIFNKITNEIKIVNYTTYQPEKFDILTRLLPTEQDGKYSERRVQCLKETVYSFRGEFEDDLVKIDPQINKIGELKEKYFKIKGNLNEEVLDKMLGDITEESLNFPNKLVNYIAQILKQMNFEDFSSFINVMHHLEPLVNVMIQPSIILVLGYKAFSSCIKLLCSNGGLHDLVKKSLTKLDRDLVRNSLGIKYSAITKDLKFGIFIGSVVSLSLTAGGYAVYSFIFSNLNEGMQKRFEAPRMGGKVSTNVDMVSSFLEKLGSEYATLVTSFTKGVIKTWVSNFETIFHEVNNSTVSRKK